MNIAINLINFNCQNLFFLEKKKNNIIDGCFSKIIYSSDCFAMNGLFFVIPITGKSSYNDNYAFNDLQDGYGYNEYADNKNIVYFYTHDLKNLQLITLLSKIENTIINTYKEMNGIKKTNSLVLTNQLYKGFIKIYGEKKHWKPANEKKYMLKISGVWENTNEVGVTYKFIEISDNKL